MNTTRALNKMYYQNVWYTIDFRLAEARPIERPYEPIPFSKMDEDMKAEVRGVRFRETCYGYIESLDEPRVIKARMRFSDTQLTHDND